MFFTDKKIEKRIEEIEKYRYRDVIHLEEFCVRNDMTGEVNPAVPTDFDGWETLKVGNYWGGYNEYIWMHKDVQIPESWKEKKIVCLFDFPSMGMWQGAFECMFYLNEAMYQGVDENHKEVFLDGHLAGSTVSMTLRWWSGFDFNGFVKRQEHKVARADLAWLDEKVDDFYYMSSMVLDTVRYLDKYNPVRQELLTSLDRIFLCIDWSYPGSDLFYESVYRADKLLNQVVDEMDKQSMVNVFCIGHTHIDTAWLWTLKHTKEKCSRSFSTVLRMMEMYPEYLFLQTQPQLYEFMKEEFPELYEKIKERVREGRWETDGAMWVEADCNLTSGESLTRQILLGSKFIKEEFDHEVEFLWLPDVFGYSWALPQILKKAGIHTFMTTKIAWSQYNRMPHDTFIWRGIDGSEVLTHFITTPDANVNVNRGDESRATYSGTMFPNVIQGCWDAYKDKEINKDLLIAYGHGDGGGGVSRDMLERRRRMDKIPGLPNLKPAKAGDYFRKLHETIENTDRYVHTWDGELYLEYHRGTYTSQAYNKKMNRKMELLYRKVEWMTVMKALLKNNLSEAKQEILTVGWKHLLTNQFHDIIPGSSIHEVYEDCKKDYPYIERIAREVEQDFYQDVVQEKANTYTVFNSSGWIRSGIVEIPETEYGVWKDENGIVLPAQQTEKGVYVELTDIPAMGYKVISLDDCQVESVRSGFQIQGKEIETPYYQIAFNESGQIEKLYDKTYGREVLPKGERANVLQVFEDKPMSYDAWDIDLFYQQKMREITDLVSFRIVESGGLKTVIRMKWKYMNSTVSQDVILYRNNRRIDFKTSVDYHEQHQLLKAAFPVDIRSTYATYDVQYGNVRRPNNWNTSWDQAKFESVAHRWADLSERNYGVSILNDCKYGHDIKDNVIRITLLKAATEPDHLQDQGIHEFTYSLLPHEGDFVSGRIVQEAFDLNEPLEVVKGEVTLPFKSFLNVDSEEIELDAVKKSEDGKYIVIRFHEFAGARQSVNLKPGFSYISWAEGDLLERVIGEKHIENKIQLELTPYEIKTLLFEI